MCGDTVNCITIAVMFNTACCLADLDGNQVLDFYWTDPIDSMIISVAKPQYKVKLYTTFKLETSVLEPNERVFDNAMLCFMRVPCFLGKE